MLVLMHSLDERLIYGCYKVRLLQGVLFPMPMPLPSLPTHQHANPPAT